MYNTKSALECNLWNSGDKVSNVGLSIVTNIPLGRGGDVDSGEGHMCQRRGHMGNLCTFLLILP